MVDILCDGEGVAVWLVDGVEEMIHLLSDDMVDGPVRVDGYLRCGNVSCSH